MSRPDVFWTIRFSIESRRDFSRIPRGRAAEFDEAIQLLAKGPDHPPNVEQVGTHEYQYRFNGFRIAFQVVEDVANTVRVIAFKEE
jgi:mRNA-degrading endonuclease RelE of RelBE toxin-antitoxin system